MAGPVFVFLRRFCHIFSMGSSTAHVNADLGGHCTPYADEPTSLAPSSRTKCIATRPLKYRQVTDGFFFGSLPDEPSGLTNAKHFAENFSFH
jgi:hypothetical protein